MNKSMNSEKGPIVDREDERLLACAWYIFRNNRDHTGNSIECSEIFREDELAKGTKEKLQRKLKAKFLPQVKHADGIQKKNLFDGDRAKDLDVAARELLNEEVVKCFMVNNYCDAMNKIGTYKVTPAELKKLKEQLARKKRALQDKKEDPITSNKQARIDQQACIPLQASNFLIPPLGPSSSMNFQTPNEFTTPMAPRHPYVAHTQLPRKARIPEAPEKPLEASMAYGILKQSPQDPPQDVLPIYTVNGTPMNGAATTPMTMNYVMNPTLYEPEHAIIRGNKLEPRLISCSGCLRKDASEAFPFFLGKMNEAAFLRGIPSKLIALPCWTNNTFEFSDGKWLYGLEKDCAYNSELVIRSVECSRIIRHTNLETEEPLDNSNLSQRCIKCGDAAENARKMYKRSGEEEREKLLENKNTKLETIAKWPDKALRKMRKLAFELNKQKGRRVSRHLQRRGVKAEGKKADALQAAMKFVKDHFEEKLKDDGGLNEDDKAKYKLMYVMYENIQTTLANGGRKKRGRRFNRLVINFAVQMAIKLGRTQYQALAAAFGWPTIGRVQQLKKDIAGGVKLSWDGLCRESVKSMKDIANANDWAEDERLVCLSHDSTMVAEGVMTDFNDSITNLDLTIPFDIVNQKFTEMAKKFTGADAAGEDEDEELGGSFEENLGNVAKHHLVAIATPVSSTHAKSYNQVVGALNLAENEAACLSNFLDQLIVHLHTAGFDVVAAVGDGAGENTALWRNWSRLKIRDFIPNELQDKHNTIDYDFSIGCRDHPVTGEPIILLQDMPHGLKRICHNLENSSMKGKKRNLMRGNQPANFNMIWYIFKSMLSGNEFGLTTVPLTKAHFFKTPLSRMNVKLAVQMLSKRTRAMLMEARGKNVEEFKKMTGGLHPDQYDFLCTLIHNVNRFVDIVNGIAEDGTKNPFTPQNGRAIQTELLQILSFFSDWKSSNEKEKNMDEWNFLAEATWVGLQQMVLGYVALIQVHCIKKGRSINPRRTTSDPCEHYFARCRASFGSTDTGTAHDFLVALRNEQALKTVVRMSSKSNNAAAGS